jgi:SAM-dependent methyltransferase
VLDLGCGTGFVARPLAARFGHVDAVDISLAMIEEGKRLPGGDRTNLRWILGDAESAPLEPPYALVTAGDSLHWMDWTVVLPRIAQISPRGHLALLDVDARLEGLAEDARLAIEELKRRHGTYARPRMGILQQIEEHGLFRELGRVDTSPVRRRQGIDDYIRSLHAGASLSWSRMGRGDAEAFDSELRVILADGFGDSVVVEVVGSVVWGRPL